METIESGETATKPTPTGKLLTNLPLPRAMEDYLHTATPQDPPCFALVGDLTLEGRYGESALLFFPDSVVAYDSAKRPEPQVFRYAELAEVKVRRMYGNALFQAEMADGKRTTLLRFTYAAAVVAEAAAEFAKAVNDDGYRPALLEAVQASYERLHSFCPKCGRKLRSPDAPCINCESKSKVFQKLAVYVKPHIVPLLACLLMS
ncbi:MAG: hypothetical protein LBS96_03760, partial [Oscillospiraceae bacterium]|nr:hypothetical protein [Oscillospiraceae bacterium]